VIRPIIVLLSLPLEIRTVKVDAQRAQARVNVGPLSLVLPPVLSILAPAAPNVGIDSLPRPL
jgi:hypothetical protein